MAESRPLERPVPLSVCFLRPRLGTGGAERLVVDAALGLQRRGHRVRFVVGDATGPQFPAVADGQLDVTVAGAFIPNHLGQRCRLPLAIAQVCAGAWAIARATWTPEVVICDVAPQAVPFVKRVLPAPVLYLCYFPDLLLTPDRRGLPGWYQQYRRPLDQLEEMGLAAADRLVVISRFTEDTVRATFPKLRSARLSVLHPGVNLDSNPPAPRAVGQPDPGTISVLSISRFDPRKNLPLAIEAMAFARSLLPEQTFRRATLVVAGHYDARFREQRQVLAELQRLTEERQLASHVEFVLSPTDAELQALLAAARCVVYTPVAEHFGYVPLEGMAARRPVVASDRGGPTETVQHGETGFLCAANPEAFGEALATLILDEDLSRRMGAAGRERVEQSFSVEVFAARLESLALELVRGARHRAMAEAAERPE